MTSAAFVPAHCWFLCWTCEWSSAEWRVVTWRRELLEVCTAETDTNWETVMTPLILLWVTVCTAAGTVSLIGRLTERLILWLCSLSRVRFLCTMTRYCSLFLRLLSGESKAEKTDKEEGSTHSESSPQGESSLKIYSTVEVSLPHDENQPGNSDTSFINLKRDLFWWLMMDRTETSGFFWLWILFFITLRSPPVSLKHTHTHTQTFRGK